MNTGLMPVGTLLSAIGFTFSLVFATQGLLQTWTDMRQTRSSVRRVQDLFDEITVDPSMAQALPPGAWWERRWPLWGRLSPWMCPRAPLTE